MERDKLDQIKRVLRAGAAVVLIACLTLMFTNMWKATYNMGVVFPFYNKGTKPEDAAGRGKAGAR